MREYAVSFQNQPVDVSEEFSKQESHFFVGSNIEEFDPQTATGRLWWKSMALNQRVSYHQITLPLEDYRVWQDVPPEEYQDDRDLPFSISFITPKTVRLRLSARPDTTIYEPFSLILDGAPGTDGSWERTGSKSSSTYKSRFGSVTLTYDPWHLEFRDASGRFLTRTHHLSDAKGVINSTPIPFSFIRTGSLLYEQSRLWHVRAHHRSLDVRSRTLPRWSERDLPRRRLPRSVLLLWHSQGDPLRVHGFDRACQDAAAVVVRVVDGPRYLLLGRRGSGRRKEATRALDPLRCGPHRHRM